MWMRTIDSAQRRVAFQQPRTTLVPLREVAFHIQGLQVVSDSGEVQQFDWSDMVDHGIRHQQEPPLSIWARLLRREAKVGVLDFSQMGRVRMIFWTDPALDLEYDLTEPEEAALFRECEIMVLSAGFHFRQTGTANRGYKTGIFEAGMSK